MINRKRLIALILCAFMMISATYITAFADLDAANAERDAFRTDFDKVFANGTPDEIYTKLQTDLRGLESKEIDIVAKIDENQMHRLVKENLGVQAETRTDYDVDFFENGELSQSVTDDLQNHLAPIPMFRYGGTSANYIDWVVNLGPVDERKSSVTTNFTYVPNQSVTKKDPLKLFPSMAMGPGELINMQLTNNPESSVIPCISWYRMPPENCEKLARFFYDDPEESSWGKMRVEQYGIKEPVNVFYWEMANEIDYYAERDGDITDVYTSWVRDAAEKIREVNPDAKIIACGPSAPWGYTVDWKAWVYDLADALADVIDGISFHPYYDGYSPEMMMGFMSEIKKILDDAVVRHDIRDKDGNLKEMKIVGTEGARFASPVSGLPHTATYQAALCNVMFVNMIFQKDYIDGNSLHTLIGTTLWPFWTKSGSRMLATPSAKLYGLYIENLGDRIVWSDWAYKPEEGEEPIWWASNLAWETEKNENNSDVLSRVGLSQGSSNFSINVMGSGRNELAVVLTNKSDRETFNIDFEFNNSYTLIKEQYTTAPNYCVYTWDEKTEAMVEIISEEKNEADFSSYTLKPNTMAVLRLKTTSRLPLLGEDAQNADGGDSELNVELTDESFADINGYWAKSEIELMRQQGFVNGAGEKSFRPLDAVTRGEFYTILTRMLKAHGLYKGSAFTDVDEQAWYLDGANLAFTEGIIKGNEFKADSSLDFFELCTTVKKIAENRNVLPSVNDNNIDISFDTSSWTQDDKTAVKYAMDNGYINRLYESASLDINRFVTRGEATAVLYRLFVKLGL